jgi:hypothetical protein
MTYKDSSWVISAIVDGIVPLRILVERCLERDGGENKASG